MNGFTQVAAIGDSLKVTGGAYLTYDAVSATLVTPIPAACRSRTYWVMNTSGIQVLKP
jgi:hypothetical protein